MRALLLALRQVWCGLQWGGHNEVLHYEKGFYVVRCTTCGKYSPGWWVK